MALSWACKVKRELGEIGVFVGGAILESKEQTRPSSVLTWKIDGKKTKLNFGRNLAEI